MKFLKKLCERILDWLATGNMAGYVILLVIATVLGLMYGGGMILDKALGHIDTPWLPIIGFCLALATLFAIWFIEEDLAKQTMEFKRRDKYLCGAIGGLVSRSAYCWRR